MFRYSRNCFNDGAIVCLLLLISLNHLLTNNLFSSMSGIQSAIVAILTNGSIRSYKRLISERSICSFFATARQSLNATLAQQISLNFMFVDICGLTQAIGSGTRSSA